MRVPVSRGSSGSAQLDRPAGAGMMVVPVMALRQEHLS
jgi:hypothetical protein